MELRDLAQCGMLGKILRRLGIVRLACNTVFGLSVSFGAPAAFCLLSKQVVLSVSADAIPAEDHFLCLARVPLALVFSEGRPGVGEGREGMSSRS